MMELRGYFNRSIPPVARQNRCDRMEEEEKKSSVDVRELVLWETPIIMDRPSIIRRRPRQ